MYPRFTKPEETFIKESTEGEGTSEEKRSRKEGVRGKGYNSYVKIFY